MTLAWIDAGRGAAGDMLLGALWDAGAARDAIRAAVRAVVPADVIFEHEVRDGFRVARVRVVVDATDRDTDRTWSAIRDMLVRSPLDAAVRERAIAAFELLARAEAAIHGEDIGNIHFHEVGGHDSIADIVGTAAAVVNLGIDRVVTTPVALGFAGSGGIAPSHGPLPLPVPAVLEIARISEVPVISGDAVGEACTPTGIALLASLTDSWGALPLLRIGATGVGAGSRPTPGRFGALRVVIGAAVAAVGSSAPEIELVTSSNVDDLDPRLWPRVLAQLLAAGADDAWLTPMLMKKGRPAHTLSVLSTPEAADAIRRVILTETTAIGLRVHAVAKHALPRDEVVVDVAGQQVRVKRAYLDGRVVNAQPEWEDVASAAAALGLPAKQVLARALGSDLL